MTVEVRKIQVDGKKDVEIIAKNVPEIHYDDKAFKVSYSITDGGSQIRFRVVPINNKKTN